MLREILLAVIVSIDIYLASAAYSNSGIRIPMLSAGVISLVCSAVLGISLRFSVWISGLISVGLCRRLGTAVLIAIGTVTLMKSAVRALVKRITDRGGMSLRIGSAALAVRIYLDETAADTDGSKILSAGEAISLALASSLDCAATGLGSGHIGIDTTAAVALTFAAGYAAIYAGSLTGSLLSRLRADMSWVSGVLLIVFAVISAE